MNYPITTVRVPATRKPTVLQMSGAYLTVGTSVMTASGMQAAEELKPGQLLVTKDFGLQKLRYIAFQDVDLITSPELAPIKIECQQLGFENSSYLAPDAQISVRHPMFDMMFGNSEVLVKCSDLIDYPGFETVKNLQSITYVALGFARRQILSCNGASIDIGPANHKTSRTSLGADEARLAMQLLQPREIPAKRHSFPLH